MLSIREIQQICKEKNKIALIKSGHLCGFIAPENTKQNQTSKKGVQK